ncbi:uncharacterized protein LOC118501899 [Phyllostomus discolor]|uniref:Uncharacterized protein LOC118501899 n=1 Tax=Phyllostomus discolor TaxID=89673 RepID=A0A7E6E927_9CHIR|nr:uncharacterized protein LOC118501899 [Phyllostomus discolor]
MCVPSPEHTLRTLSTNRRGEGEAPPPAPSIYIPRGTRPAPARLTLGPYVSVSAGGGEKRGFCARVAAGGGARAACGLVGEGRIYSPAALRVVGWDGPAFQTPRPDIHPGEALTRQHRGGRCAGLPGSSAVTTLHVHGSPGLLPPQPARLRSPPPLRNAGPEWAGVIPSRPSIRNVREKSQGWLSPSPTRTVLRIPAGSTAPRVGRRSGACWELESPTAAAPADPNWSRALVAPNRPGAEPRLPPRAIHRCDPCYQFLMCPRILGEHKYVSNDSMPSLCAWVFPINL